MALIFSVCPSLWGWYPLEILRSMPQILHSACEKRAMNCGPLSETMLSGSPCSLATFNIYGFANSSALVVSLHAMKCRIFESLSTTTITALYPFDSGNPVMKSIETSFQLSVGMGSGLNIPNGACLAVLDRWQV